MIQPCSSPTASRVLVRLHHHISYLVSRGRTEGTPFGCPARAGRKNARTIFLAMSKFRHPRPHPTTSLAHFTGEEHSSTATSVLPCLLSLTSLGLVYYEMLNIQTNRDCKVLFQSEVGLFYALSTSAVAIGIVTLHHVVRQYFFRFIVQPHLPILLFYFDKRSTLLIHNFKILSRFSEEVKCRLEERSFAPSFSTSSHKTYLPHIQHHRTKSRCFPPAVRQSAPTLSAELGCTTFPPSSTQPPTTASTSNSSTKTSSMSLKTSPAAPRPPTT